MDDAGHAARAADQEQHLVAVHDVTSRKNGSVGKRLFHFGQGDVAAEHQGGGFDVAHVQGVAPDQAAEDAFAVGIFLLLRADGQQAPRPRVAQGVVRFAADPG